MSLIQNFFLTILPKSWADDMRAESQAWQIRCLTCGKSKSVWEIGGIRWKAASAGKRTIIRCSTCGGLKAATLEYVPRNRVTSG